MDINKIKKYYKEGSKYVNIASYINGATTSALIAYSFIKGTGININKLSKQQEIYTTHFTPVIEEIIKMKAKKDGKLWQMIFVQNVTEMAYYIGKGIFTKYSMLHVIKCRSYTAIMHVITGILHTAHMGPIAIIVHHLWNKKTYNEEAIDRLVGYNKEK